MFFYYNYSINRTSLGRGTGGKEGREGPGRGGRSGKTKPPSNGISLLLDLDLNVGGDSFLEFDSGSRA